MNPGNAFACLRFLLVLLLLSGLAAPRLAAAQSTTLSLQLDPNTCANATNGQTLIGPGVNPRELRTLWGQPNCKGTLTFSKQASERLFLANGIDASIELPGSVNATSGSIALELTPGPAPNYLSIALQPNSNAIVELPPLTVVETTDLQAPATPAAGNPWVASSLTSMDTIDWTSPPANSGLGRCSGGAGENTIYRGAPMPLRWLPSGLINPLNPGNPIANDQLGGYLHSLDVQKRVVNGIEQWRVSLQLPDTDGVPTWLQTQWNDVSGGSGERKFNGFLRRHTWNGKTRMRNAGVPVGVIVLAPRDHGPANGLILPGLGMRVNWRIEAKGLRSSPASGWMGCLHPGGSEVVDAQTGNSPVNSTGENSAYTGVWGGIHSKLARVEDAMAVNVGESQLTESHVLRVWDEAGKPVWLGSSAVRPAWTLPTVEGATSTSLKLMAFMSTPSSLTTQRNCWIDLKKISNNQNVYLQRELAVAGGFLYDGRLGFDIAGVRALAPGICATEGVASLNSLNWTYPAVTENPGPLNTRWTDIFNPYRARLDVFPRICRLQGVLGESCPVRLSFAGAEGYRIRRNTTIIHPQTGTLPKSGVRSDAVAALGQHCYSVVDGSNEPVSESACVTVRNRAEMPPGLSCAKFALGSVASSTRCDDTTLPVLNAVAPGTSVKIKLLVPDARVAKIHISRGFFTQPMEVQIDGQQPFVNLPIETPAFAATMVSNYYEFELRTCDVENLCSAPITLGLAVGDQLQAPTIPAADSPYPEIVRLAWSHMNTKPDNPVTFKIARWSTADVLQQPEITGVPGMPSASGVPGATETVYAFAVPGGTTWRYGVAACRGTTCSPWAKVDALVAAADLNLQVTPTTSPSGVFTLNWKSIPGTLRYEAQTAPGEPLGTWVSPATNVPPSSNATVTRIWPVLPANMHRFRVRGCANVTPIGVVCGLYAQSGTVTSTLGGGVVEIADDPRGALYDASQHDYRRAEGPVLLDHLGNNAGVGKEVAGALTGEPGVVGGSASYSIPIEMPPGRRGMQPAVSIGYSSRAGNGPLGMGFSLSAGGAISRCPSTRATDPEGFRPVQFDAADKLCLDGQRLLIDPLSPQPYGNAGAIYRTEIESWNRVTQMGGDLGTDNAVSFMVEMRDGEIRYYGRGYPGSVSPASDYARVRPGELTGNARTMSWLLDTREDRAGNQVFYRYKVEAVGEHLLDEIVYTAHKFPVGPSPEPGTRRVRFIYETGTRPDVASAYLGGGLTLQTKRLARIETGLWPTGASELDVMATYTLRYELSKAGGRSLLMGIRRCGDNSAADRCLKETTFVWADTPGPTPNLVAGTISWPVETNPTTSHLDNVPLTDGFMPVGDVDGDGTTELLRTVSQGPGLLKRYLVSFRADRTYNWHTAFDQLNGERFADFNNDGRVDPWWVDNGMLKVQFWSGGALSAVYTSPWQCGLTGLPLDVRATDVNSDGQADLVVETNSQCTAPANQYGLHVLLNTTPAPTGTQPTTALTFGASLFQPLQGQNPETQSDEELQQIQDLNGDGWAEFMTTECQVPCNGDANGEVSYHNRVLSVGPTGLSAPAQFRDALYAPNDGQPNQIPGTARRHAFTDINGDGLQDLILATRTPAGKSSCQSAWHYRLHNGKRFGPLIRFGGADTAGIEEDTETGNCRPVVRDWDGAITSITTFEDLDGDGRTEILVPQGFKDRICGNARYQIVVGGTTSADFDPVKVCPPEPRESNAVLDPLKDGRILLSDHHDYTLATTLNDNFNNVITAAAEVMDHASYRMGRLVIGYNPDTSRFELEERDLTYTDETGTHAYFRQTNVRDTNRESMDVYGDGLTDAFASEGCRLQWRSPSGAVADACRYPDNPGVAVPAYVFKNLINHGAGFTAGQHLASKSTEMLTSVSDSFGEQVRWTYDPLSSKGGRSGGLPLYQIPSRTSGQPYVDARHFYFASSMNVVAKMEIRNGVGGFNVLNYGYEEAMYNNQGRGFVGFRKIVTEDLSAGIRSATVFHQKFPLVSQATCQATQKLADDFNQLRCGTAAQPIVPTSLLSHTVVDQYQCNGSPCPESGTTSVGQIWRVVSNRSVQQSWEATEPTQLNLNAPYLRGRLVTQTTSQVASRDAYDNVLRQDTTITDRVNTATDTETIRTHETTTVADYTPNPASWWLNRLDRQILKVKQTYSGPHAADAPNPNPERHTATLYAYDGTLRSSTCEALFAGANEPAVGAQCLSQPNAESRIAREYLDGYGNLTREETTARLETNTPRLVTTNYASSGGYFPQQVSDGFNRSVYSVVSPKFGKPTSTTDANGLVTTIHLDPLGRPVRTILPSRNSLKTGFDVITAYERCSWLDAGLCPQHGVLRTIQSQYGAPQSLTYVDVLGRTLRTSTKLLNANFEGQGLTDFNASVSETEYTAAGQILQQYEPGRSMRNPLAKTMFFYDDINRPVTKLQRFNAVDQDSVADQSDHFRRTEYTYAGLKTEIRVCQTRLLANQTCAESAGMPNRPFQLSMSRQFDSAQRLLSTTDAAQNTTRYWFDGAGNPLQIRDVKGLKTTAKYNDFGHRIEMKDPNHTLTWTFSYNGYGELKTRTDARGLSTSHTYDKLGRTIGRTWNEPGRSGGSMAFNETTQYDTDASPGNVLYGTVKWVDRNGVGSSGAQNEHFRRTFVYDTLARTVETRTQMDVGTTESLLLTSETRYDSRYGRVKQLVYPTSAIDGLPVSLYQAYDHLGVLVREGFAADYNANAPWQSDAIRSLEAVDGRGLPLTQRLGVRGTTQDYFHLNFFDTSGWMLANCTGTTEMCNANQPNSPTGQVLDQRYRFDVYGNLVTQWHNGVWKDGEQIITNQTRGSETYTYDALMRLTENRRKNWNNVETITQYGYDEIGNLKKKSDYSVNNDNGYAYQSGTHRLSAVTLAAGGSTTYGYDDNGNVNTRTEPGNNVTTLRYDIDNLPVQISRSVNGSTQTSAFYEGPGGRWLQRLQSNGSTVRNTWMLEKTYERETNAGNVPQLERYYLSGGHLLTIAPGVNGRKFSYLHTDRLGSPVSITEKQLPADGTQGSATPVLVEHRGFDPFGKALDGRWTADNLGLLNLSPGGIGSYNTGKRNQRGYTGHEHLDEFALIHMNGRAYDYNVGRFFGVDPFIQFPSNSQSLNPYAYLMNNPLAGTDPTGYQICTGTRLPRCGARASSVKLLGDGPGPVKEGGRYLTLSEQRARTLPRLVWPQDLGSQSNRPQIGPGDLSDEELAERAHLDDYSESEAAAPGPSGWSFGFPFIDDLMTPADARQPRSQMIQRQFADDIRRSRPRTREEFLERVANTLSLAVGGVRLGAIRRSGQTFGRSASCGLCRCFAAGTLVLTAEGDKAIEDLNVGDLVVARDEVTGKDVLRPVLETYVNLHRDVWELRFADASGKESVLSVTLEHPFHTRAGEWKPAGELKVGEQVAGKEQWLTLTQRRDLPDDVSTYNFKVAQDHNYFVGEQRLWVHNCCTFIGNSTGDLLDLRIFGGLSRTPGVLKATGRSGGTLPLFGSPNSFSVTAGGHARVFDGNGRVIFDVSRDRIKAFEWNQGPSGQWFPKVGSETKFSPVPDAVLNALGL